MDDGIIHRHAGQVGRHVPNVLEGGRAGKRIAGATNLLGPTISAERGDEVVAIQRAGSQTRHRAGTGQDQRGESWSRLGRKRASSASDIRVCGIIRRGEARDAIDIAAGVAHEQVIAISTVFQTINVAHVGSYLPPISALVEIQGVARDPHTVGTRETNSEDGLHRIPEA